MKILLTGFEPFDNSPINPSEQIVRTLEDEAIPGVQLETVVLPVDLMRGSEILLGALEAARPDAALCLGQASRRSVISIERIAVNLLDFRIPDNAYSLAQASQPLRTGIQSVQNSHTALYQSLPLGGIGSPQLSRLHFRQAGQYDEVVHIGEMHNDSFR